MCRDADRHLHMHFLRTPLELLPRSPGCPAVGGVKLEVNQLQAREDGSQAAVGLGQHETLPVRICSAECTALHINTGLHQGSSSCCTSFCLGIYQITKGYVCMCGKLLNSDSIWLFMQKVRARGAAAHKQSCRAAGQAGVPHNSPVCRLIWFLVASATALRPYRGLLLMRDAVWSCIGDPTHSYALCTVFVVA